VKSQPFEMSFTRQINTVRKLYGRQLNVGFDMNNVAAAIDRYIEFYPARDRGLIRDRIEFCIKKQLKLFKEG
jgi:hypothetical protein